MSDALADNTEQHRRFARSNPITPNFWLAIMQCPALMKPYSFRINDKFFAVFTYSERRIKECSIKPPFWHVQIAILAPAAEINLKLRMQGKPLTVEQDALLTLQSWSEDEVKEAHDVAMTLLEPLMKRDSQVGHVHGGLWETHFFLAALPEHEKYANAH